MSATLLRLSLCGAMVPLAALAARLPAQTAELRMSHFTVEHGLAQNAVTAIAQDSAGFLWVGTKRGLQRFDGYDFVSVAILDSTAALELSGPITDLQVDRNGRLWILASGRLFWGRLGRERLRSVPAGGRLAAASGGQLWYDRITPHRIDWHADSPRVTVLPFALPKSCCGPMATGPDGILWLTRGSPDSATVTRLDPVSGTRREFPLAAISQVADLTADSGGRVWAGGFGGVEVLEPGANRFRELAAFRGASVGAIARDGPDGLLVAAQGWIARTDRRGHITERWNGTPRLPTRLRADREGGWWLATLGEGLHRLDLAPPVFSDRPGGASREPLPRGAGFVMALGETRDGSLWIGTLGSGGYRYSGRVGPTGWRRYPPGRDGLPHGEIWDFAEDTEGGWWVGTTAGLCRMEESGPRCVRRLGRSFPVADIAPTADGWFWLAMGGPTAVAFHPATGQFGDTLSVPHAVITAFADTTTGDLWLGGSRVHRAQVHGGRVTRPPEQAPAGLDGADYVFQFARDSRGRFWMASDRGLQRWDPRIGRFASPQGIDLAGTSVFSILEDDTGRLWLGTAHGLVHYSPETGRTRRYGRADGIPSGEFNRRAALRRRSGEMVFGGVAGLTVFDPEVVTGRRPPPPLVITRLQTVTAAGPANLHATTESPAILGPEDRSLTVEFAALTFLPGPVRRYRHRLEGLSPDWTVSTDHRVTIPTPPPGRYRLLVQTAAGGEGWGAPGLVFPFEVTPPFWGTRRFRLAVGTLLLALLWAGHRFRLRNAVATERLRLRIARDLHDEIGAGLSSIALISDAIGSAAGVPPGERHRLQRIGGSARGMVADLRDIVWAIDPGEDRLYDVIERTRDVASDLLPGVRITFHGPPPEQMARRIGLVQRRDLLRLYKEALHNVARHAQAGNVDISISVSGSAIELTITDDGMGFEPGTVRAGTGLASMRERARTLGGTLEITSAPGRGTIVKCGLPAT
ncbi:MAG TPA: two-component regulator propeller domain-containing protein [Gemmatimonadales bacterium]|nr:two-component regulator propeller domain-containing protein [Gemmatimonadales bacterium]